VKVHIVPTLANVLLTVSSAWALSVAVPVVAQDLVPDGVIVMRAADTMLASDLGAIDVVTADGETLGDVTDTILSRDGRIVALVVGMGGVLGVAEKPVAIAWEHLKVRALPDGFEFVCDLDRSVLDAAPVHRDRDG